jgi:hypothetical protein
LRLLYWNNCQWKSFETIMELLKFFPKRKYSLTSIMFCSSKIDVYFNVIIGYNHICYGTSLSPHGAFLLFCNLSSFLFYIWTLWPFRNYVYWKWALINIKQFCFICVQFTRLALLWHMFLDSSCVLAQHGTFFKINQQWKNVND